MDNNMDTNMEIQIYKPRLGDQQSSAAEECECPICQETIKDTKTTSCRHTFCVSCLDKWLEIKYTCPLCRRIIGLPKSNNMNIEGLRFFPVVYYRHRIEPLRIIP